MPSSFIRASILALLTVFTARAAAAQSSPPRDEPSVCLGFSFGVWAPALDWRVAGHGARPDTSRLQHASSGRDWATPASAGAPDSLLILFPAWWPAGVVVDLPTRTPALGDTITGRARAFVADGNAKIPTTRVRAWQVSCAR